MKYALVYGLLAAGVVGAVIVSGIAFHLHGVFQTVWFGYLVMVVAMTFVFVGVRRYRDVEKGGVIRFLPALGMGLAIGLVAVIAYVAIWEIYLAATHYDFIEKFFRGPEMAELKAYYSNPLYRMWETAKELGPVALIVAFVSAALLRNPKLLPARVSG